MSKVTKARVLALGVALGLMGPLATTSAQETIKLGLSVPLSGGGAVWGKGSVFMCERATREINEAGGVTVGGQAYNFECVAYDNKYNAAEGTRVAQTLLNREGVKFIGGSLGTAPVKAMQSLTERQGVLLFTTAWGFSIKGPEFPLTFTQMNTPFEILPNLIPYIRNAHPETRTLAMLNPNDASGQETEEVARGVWENTGIEILTSDYYERGTTEFQPIAARLAALDPDIIDLGGSPPADAGAVFRELEALGWDGVKVVQVGTGADGLKATGGASIEGVYMGAAVSFEGTDITDHQREVNEEARAEIGESLNAIQIGFYDSIYALKAGMEAANSIDPKEVARVLPDTKFRTFYGGEIGLYGEETYGSNQQMRLPVIVTQIQDGVLIELDRVVPGGN